MKVLIAVASKHGSTREIAQAIAEELRNASVDVDLKDINQVMGTAGYDAVILGSAIYAGNWLPDAKQFAQQHNVALTTVPVWVFSSGPLGGEDPQPHNDPAVLAAPLGEVKPQDHHIFTGKLDPETLGFAERLITKVIQPPEGDFRNWEEIRGWARQIAAELPAATAR